MDLSRRRVFPATEGEMFEENFGREEAMLREVVASSHFRVANCTNRCIPEVFSVLAKIRE